MKSLFKPSKVFFEMVFTLKEVMLFKDVKWLAVLLWMVFPAVPAIVLGWYLAEISNNLFS